MAFSRQEYCSGLPFCSPGDLPDLRIESRVSCIRRETKKEKKIRDGNGSTLKHWEMIFLFTGLTNLTWIFPQCFLTINHPVKMKNTLWNSEARDRPYTVRWSLKDIKSKWCSFCWMGDIKGFINRGRKRESILGSLKKARRACTDFRTDYKSLNVPSIWGGGCVWQ